MRSVHLTHHAADVTPRDAYARIGDFARYPELVDTVRRVSVRPDTGDGVIGSDWEVDFRNGVLAWEEEDVFDDSALTISFRQTRGDFDTFDGHWQVTPQGTGCRVEFSAAFDFGLPTLANIVDPVAERVLKQTIGHVLHALIGGEEVAA
ncbi:type II toxin-antitoxin system RatA family toxin [Streptomyces roseicoloratus]|uniref:SRPBCC family protein n=1 Tax=Streptomyces roseicoloratus TaxID=2508722 RepID=A0ABY9RPS6_9ACTN|nr:SRPBCC family protein [Streptomyces roseicoloratus]WMX44202.1 SRPBCC family protein [Streptomyces roseicoloratus]